MPRDMFSRFTGVILVGAIALAAGNAGEARAQSLPLPPGTILTGTVFRGPVSCNPPTSVPQITTGDEANKYICEPPGVPSFVPTGPASMVVTSEPTQYVRTYCPDCATMPSQAAGGFIVDPSTIRGLTPAQIQDVLALPNVNDMITIVTVPAGSCVLVAFGAPAFGGSGGPAQEYAAGTPTNPTNCQGLQFLDGSDYINRQAIGAFALLYAPRAGSGNSGAVAAALDRGPYPAPFTDMDLIYKSLDLLNFGDPGPLRAALVQLDGEVYADFSSVAIGAGQLFLGALRQRMRVESTATDPVRQWLSAFGAASGLSGNGDSHDFNAGTGGVAGGFEQRFNSALRAGIAFGYAYTGFSTNGIPGAAAPILSRSRLTPAMRRDHGTSKVRSASATMMQRSPAASYSRGSRARPTGRRAGRRSSRSSKPAIA